MAAPPAVLLEPVDNEAFLGMIRGLTQLKRKLSLKIGAPGNSLEDMHAAKVLLGFIGTSPSPAKLALVAAQGQVTREEILQEVHVLKSVAFDTVSSFESYAAKIEVNSEASIDAKRKEILKGIEALSYTIERLPLSN